MEKDIPVAAMDVEAIPVDINGKEKNMIKAVLFDLDGTLLPMDQDAFIKTYFHALAKKMASYGYEPETLMKAVGAGTMAMVKNDGSITNEERFWRTFGQFFDKDVRKDESIFEDFYRNEFDQAKVCCGFHVKARMLVDICKEQGYRVVLATNPLFPAIATQKRIAWAGLVPEDFEIYTTFEHYSHCKPNLKYYEEILSKMNLLPEECVMIGNDVNEDMIARQLGMKVFLLTDCLLNRDNKDIAVYPNGSFEEAIEYVKGGL
jgi:FMN phosphatase YigB (HAD superfamily)